MLKIARPVSLMLMSAALFTTETTFASSEAATPNVGISQQQTSLRGIVEDEFGPVAGASVVVKGTTNGTAPCMLPHNRNCHNIFYPLPHLFTYLSKTHLSRQI